MVTSNIIIETIINKLKFDYSNEEGNSAYKEILIGGDKLLVIRVSNHRTHLQTWADRYPRTLQPSRKLIKKMGNNLPIVYRKKYFFSFVFEDEPTAPDTNVKGKKVVVFESVQETKDIQDNQVLLIIRGLSNFMKNPAQYDATILGNQEKVTNITTENKTTKDMKESKQTVKLNESQLRQVIKESIKSIISEKHGTPSSSDLERMDMLGSQNYYDKDDSNYYRYTLMSMKRGLQDLAVGATNMCPLNRSFLSQNERAAIPYAHAILKEIKKIELYMSRISQLYKMDIGLSDDDTKPFMWRNYPDEHIPFADAACGETI